MRPVIFYASERHYVDHLAPLAYALTAGGDAVDGLAEVSVAAGSRDAFQRFAAYGIDPTMTRRPVGTATQRRRRRRGSTPDNQRPLIVVASFGDYRRARAVGHVVLVEHGAGQTYVGADPDSPYHAGGRGRDDVVMFLCPNEAVAEANRRRYPSTPALVVGSPRVESLRAARVASAPNRAHPSGVPGVTFSTHWDCHICPESRWAFPHFAPALGPLNDDGNPWRLYGHAHPRAWPDLNDWYARRGITRARHFDDVVRTSDVYVVDNSSTLYEAVAVGLRVVVCDAPWYRRDVDHGLRFWRWADVGPRVDAAADLYDAVMEAACGPDRFAEVRAACTAEVFGVVEGSVARSVAGVLLAAGLDV